MKLLIKHIYERRTAMKLGAIILAGGTGERFGGKKQFFEIDGKQLWRYVYEKYVKAANTDDNISLVGIDYPGGNTRTESVKIGLSKLDIMTEKVIILEADRPLVTTEQIEKLIDDESDSSTFVMPLVNTVIYRNGTYVNRDDFYELLTPQAFNYKKLCDAYKNEKYKNMTDETRTMYEEYNIKPHFIETGDNLLKVTYPRDIAIVKELIKERPELL